VHTSAKVRPTSAAIWRISISISPNSDEYAKQSLYPDGDLDLQQNVIIRSLAHYQPSVNISCKSVQKFLRKVADSQTDKQTNNDDYISSLAEVIDC